jgi:hypothetical protein
MEVICFPVFSGGSFKGSIGADILNWPVQDAVFRSKRNGIMEADSMEELEEIVTILEALHHMRSVVNAKELLNRMHCKAIPMNSLVHSTNGKSRFPS